MSRYDRCDDTCTTDCGHCKGQGRPVADEPTAIRNPERGKAHREDDYFWTMCGGYMHPTAERVPLSQVPESDRCRTCWPTTKGVTE